MLVLDANILIRAIILSCALFHLSSYLLMPLC
jgi:hypothetical protein